MRKEIIIKATSDGTLINLCQAGVISYKVLMYRDIYFDVDALEKMGVKKTVAKQQVADQYKISIKTVYQAIKWLQQ
jgi:hypothetical protein